MSPDREETKSAGKYLSDGVAPTIVIVHVALITRRTPLLHWSLAIRRWSMARNYRTCRSEITSSRLRSMITCLLRRNTLVEERAVDKGLGDVMMSGCATCEVDTDSGVQR